MWRLTRERRRAPGFTKLLGTGRDLRFGPSSMDLTRWALLTVASTAGSGRTAASDGWNRGDGHCRLDLRPVSSRGRWSGQQPFVPDKSPQNPAGMVLALTRARLRPSRAPRFWRAIGPPADALAQATGLLAAFGIGEAPLGWQGTVSLWRRWSDLVEFAYRHPAHRRVIEATPAQRWYAEELFARFAVMRISGDRDVIGWNRDNEGSVG
jgi:hypothetical protein